MADLIVPRQDRRRRRRIMTLKNAGIVLTVFAVAFVAISIRSEMRDDRPGHYGRLVGRALPAVEQKPVEVVSEAPPPVDDQTAPDPMLVAPLAREQWLYDRRDAAAIVLPAPPPPVESARAGEGDVVIVGGPEGVSVVHRERRRPVLSGGFGR